MTPDIKELVKRLRDGFITMKCEDDVVRYTNHVAADALEAMAGEVAFAEENNRGLACAMSGMRGDMDRLTAERERLKAALVRLTTPTNISADERIAIARKALGGDA